MPILSLPRLAKRLLVFGVDAFLCIFTVWLAYYLRMGYVVPLKGEPLIAVGISLVLALPIFVSSGLYRAIFRYSGWPALLTVAKACLIYGFAYASVIVTMGFQGVPRTLGFIQPILLLFCVGFTRSFASYWLGSSYRHQLKLGAVPRVLIYGAGSAGRQLAAALRNSHQMRVVGFLDDAKELQGHVLNGITIYKPSDLSNLASSLRVNDVLLALPSVSRQRRNAILELITKSKLAVRTLPSVTDLAKGKVTASDIHDLDIEDLLGRDPVAPNPELLAKNITGQVVMVTGAGGSIGSELCRQIIRQKPKMLILFEQSEYALYLIDQELRNKLDENSTVELAPTLGSVQNASRVDEVLSLYKPYIIFHAAAYKHVPLVESNPKEGIENNVFGTQVLATAAMNQGVQHFVLVSTDKAVRPTNVMGATKRLAELVLQALAQEVKNGETIFSMVRFGNVLDSSGSVVPLFRKQIKDGGPITLTHPEVTRYFMTIPEAAQLVIQAGAMAKGGEVFVLDMGQPVKIADLAHHVIKLSGLELKNEENPEGDIEIEITGLRPGEKLYEELLIGENPEPTTHPRILKANEEFIELEVLEQRLASIHLTFRTGNQVEISNQLRATIV
ncbi:nucleoside-diphosphate sugar epimerase/dehydratase [Polynucleobacter sp. MWH-Braz-FAM2G]|uniref:polysaccharide biosynthesis protein n=1 Tax=Polynucleobacter sp. MWH-Braz-FAM2G TaxID=1855883 RepID=UPI001BFE4B25|nr:nucleoside-diphosphate sugar epimerase/dehydratase [Polynucleobacter sp. MWH-Braz-FAM2G]QWD91080.1 polysaccharide biosynthesis protein [Polynucleobacter sp. MWH-Braz-FAM2G]